MKCTKRIYKCMLLFNDYLSHHLKQNLKYKNYVNIIYIVSKKLWNVYMNIICNVLLQDEIISIHKYFFMLC